MKSKKVMGVFSINTSLCPLHPQVMLGPFLSVDFHEIGLGRTSGDGEKARALPPSPKQTQVDRAAMRIELHPHFQASPEGVARLSTGQ